MPSNIQTLNELSSIQITKSEIDTIPNYLRKFKEDSSKDIANWLLNSKSSSVSEISLISGPGISYKSNGVAPLFESYSALILGKTGFQNRWQVNFIKDKSIRDDDFIVTYFDGKNHFKRFSVEASSGTIKSRSSDFRNGNTPNCNANYQIALGYSETAPFNDYSIYRHNFRTSHSNNTSLNYENAVDLYLWDNSTDLPNDVGSRHVVRWDALGNEELIKGTRIDGGINLDISSDALKITEKNLLAVKDKGVIYYNKSSKTFRYSVDGELFNDFGSGSMSGASIESCPINQCSSYNGSLTEKTIGVYLYSEQEIDLSNISIITNEVSQSTTDIYFAIYQGSSTPVNSSTDTFAVPIAYSNGMRDFTLKTSGIISRINGEISMTTKTITPIKIKGWFAVLLGEPTGSGNPIIFASINQSEAISTVISYPMQFIRNDIIIKNTSSNIWPNTFTPKLKTDSCYENTSIIPYIKIGFN